MQMGGQVHTPIITEVEPIEERPIGKGMKAFSFKTPKGSLRVAESETGAIVGDTFEEVIADVKTASKGMLQDQIADARATIAGECKNLTNEEFFNLYNY